MPSIKHTNTAPATRSVSVSHSRHGNSCHRNSTEQLGTNNSAGVYLLDGNSGLERPLQERSLRALVIDIIMRCASHTLPPSRSPCPGRAPVRHRARNITRMPHSPHHTRGKRVLISQAQMICLFLYPREKLFADLSSIAIHLIFDFVRMGLQVSLPRPLPALSHYPVRPWDKQRLFRLRNLPEGLTTHLQVQKISSITLTFLNIHMNLQSTNQQSRSRCDLVHPIMTQSLCSTRIGDAPHLLPCRQHRIVLILKRNSPGLLRRRMISSMDQLRMSSLQYHLPQSALNKRFATVSSSFACSVNDS